MENGCAEGEEFSFYGEEHSRSRRGDSGKCCGVDSVLWQKVAHPLGVLLFR